MAFRYEIGENNAVLIFADDATEPCLIQDVDPTGGDWKSKTAATKWADAYLKGIDDRIAADIAELIASQSTEPVVTEPEVVGE